MDGMTPQEEELDDRIRLVKLTRAINNKKVRTLFEQALETMSEADLYDFVQYCREVYLEDEERCSRFVLEDRAEGITDDRLRALFIATMERLPEEERDYFVQYCGNISIGEDDQRLGAKIPDQVDVSDGVMLSELTNERLELSHDLLETYEESVAQATIAHEIAHLVLHHDNGPYIPYVDHPKYSVRDVHEWDADLLAWKWGFSAELKESWKALPHTRPVWYPPAVEPSDGEATNS